jgi:catechol 2,3-dioxygenase
MTRLPPEISIASVTLRVARLDQALAFYESLLGYRPVDSEHGRVGLSASGGAPAQIRLLEVPGAGAKPPRTTGLYHVAIRVPSRKELGRVFKRLAEQRYPFQGFADHGVSEALYLADPDGNGIEIYRDRPRSEWQWNGDSIAMVTEPLDVEGVLAEANGEAPWDGAHPQTDFGHIHLQVSDLGKAESFYVDLLGFDVMQRNFPGALFVAAGGYHHHIGLNVWSSRYAPAAPANSVGLQSFAVGVPSTHVVNDVARRLQAAGVPFEHRNGSLTTQDFDGVTVHVQAITS